MLKEDILRTYSKLNGSTLRKCISCFRSPGVHAVVIYRFGQWLLSQNILFKLLLTPIYLFLNYRLKVSWGIDIPRRTKIGAGLYIGHFGGIIIAEGAVIGKNLAISQQVTIGAAGKKENHGAPTIGDNVYLAPGAKVFGKIKIGDNVKVGANAVIHKDIPDNAVAVLDPGFTIISYNGNSPS